VNPVVITGMGAITPSGISVAELWANVSAGRSAIDVLQGEEFDDLAVRIGAQVRGFDPTSVLPRSMVRRLSPVQHWALGAADQAMRQAGALPGEDSALPWAAERFSILAATGSGPVDPQQSATRALDESGPRAVPLTLAIYGAPDAAAALLSHRYGALGDARAVCATCASAAIGLGEGLRAIRHGYADAVLVVGMEDCLNAVNLASNANMRALAAGYEDEPTRACRPFDAARSGFVMGSGAAALLLESASAARARGATPLAELAGFGAASDAHHPTAPHPEGRGAEAAMRACLTDAEVGPREVDHVNAHGTGTPAGDAAEVIALERVFGSQNRIPVSATKPATGHLLGASGAIEAIISVCALADGVLPPTLNLDDPEFPELDVVTEPRPAALTTVLSNSFGFGGHNGSIVLRRAADTEYADPCYP